MEAIYYNKTTRDKKIYKAYARYEIAKRTHIINFCMIIYALFFAVRALIEAIQSPWDRSFGFFLFMTIMAAFFAMRPHFLVWVRARKIQKDSVRLNGAESVEIEFFFEEECIRRRIVETQDEASFLYDVIACVLDTKEYCFIICSTRMLMLDKRNFLSGDPAGFVQFLRTKAPRAQFLYK